MSEHEHGATADLSALAWVADELRRLLETAQKTLRRLARDVEVLPEGVPLEGAALAALQQARAQVHQGAGALEMVGEAEGARVLRAVEDAVQRFARQPRALDHVAAQSLERASFAVLDYLRRRLAGRPSSPVALFPQYREVQALAGADRVHPADLWPGAADVAAAEAALGDAAARLDGVAPLRADADTRGHVEQCLLGLLRGPVAPAAARMGELFAGLAAGAARDGAMRLAGTWTAAAAFFEAQARGRLDADVYGKRLTSRLLAQVRLAERGGDAVADRLVQDLLFFCARAQAGDDAGAPHLAAVRRVVGAAATRAAEADYERETLGRYDPALIPQARKRVESLKESWSAATAGQSGLAASLREQATLVADAVRRLHPEGDHLARALDAAVTQVADGALVPAPGLAMEVATGLLCLDAALDDADVADAAFGARIQQLAERIEAARQGRAPGPIEPWMEELYRRASDRQTMGSVVQELRASLAEVELQLDKFNRNPRERELLIPVPARLSAMRGVLSVLGLDHAGQAVLRMRDEVDAALAAPADDGGARDAIGRLAANLGALGFLIDLLGVQPQLAKSLFRFDAATGRLETLTGRRDAGADAVAAAPAAVPAPVPVERGLLGQVQSVAQVAGDEGASKGELMQRLDALAQQATAADERTLAEAARAARSALANTDDGADAEAVRLDVAGALADYAAPEPVAPPPPTAPVSATATAEDDEMLEVFFEEAAEVLAGARESLATLEGAPADFDALTTVRRAFHTLKGSSRMVGLKDFGEAAWACEQLYNTRLADAEAEADPALRRFTANALDELDAWVQALVARDAGRFHSARLVQAATALRDGRDPDAEVSAPAAAPVVDTAAIHAAIQAMPSLDLPVLDEPAPAVAIPEPALPEPALPEPAMPEVGEASELDAHDAGDTEILPFPFDVDDIVAAREAEHREAQDTEILPRFDELEPVADLPAPAAPLLPDFTLDLPPMPGESPADEAAAPGFELAEPAPVAAGAVPDDAALDLAVDLDALDLPQVIEAGEPPAPVDAVALLPASGNTAPAAPAAEPVADVPAPPGEAEAAEAAPEAEVPVAAGIVQRHPALQARADGVAPLAGRAQSAAANDAGSDAAPAALAAEERGARTFGTLPPGSPLPPDEAENYKVIGPLRIGIGLFNIFLNEADVQSRRLNTALSEWALELPRPVDDDAVAFAHSLAGNSATVGHADLSALARRLEHALEASRNRTVGPDEAALYVDVGDEIRRLLHQFAAGFLQAPLPAVLARFDAFQAGLLEPPAAGPASPEREAPALEIPGPAVHGLEIPELQMPELVVPELVAPELVAPELAVPDPAVSGFAPAHEPLAFVDPAEPVATLAPGSLEEPHPFDVLPAAAPIAAPEVIESAELPAELSPAFAASEPLPPPELAPEQVIAPQAAADEPDAVPALPVVHEVFPADGPVDAAPLVDGVAEAVEAAVAAPETGTPAELAEPTGTVAGTGPIVDVPAAVGAAAETAAAAADGGLGGVRFSVLDEAAPLAGQRGVEVAAVVDAPEFAQDIDVHDAIDAELFGIFAEEAHELLPTLAAHLRAWEDAPAQTSEAFGAMRALHTLKGSARLAGAMRLGELAHRLETAFEDRVGGRSANPPTMATLHAGVDALSEEFQRLQQAPVTPPVAAPASEIPVARPVAADEAPMPALDDLASLPHEPVPVPTVPSPAPASPVAPATPVAIDWSRFAAGGAAHTLRPADTAGANPVTAAVRVRAPVLDRLVNQAGEVSITRSRLETGVGQMRTSLRELTENLDRLRAQLRDIELQADTQIASRLEASRSASVEFDPLEMDRFTRFQELTRMMAESVNDVATVQRSLQQAVQGAEDDMVAQARLTRALQEDLLRARMVPFDALSERLYRVVRQAAKETGVQVRLNVDGSAIELDRSVLDRMAGAFEHLLRNAVVHGIAAPEIRRAQDKDPVGTIDVALSQQGNEVRIEIRDDGNGLDLPRIEARARRQGLLADDARPSDAELANLIFTPGFSTAESVTELAGRGVGMDVVRADVTGLGGRIETASAPGRGTAFRLLLPLTTAVTRVVQLRCGDLTVAVPASLVEVVRRAPVAAVEQAYRGGRWTEGGEDLPFFWLGALLQSSVQGTLAGKTAQVLLVRSAEQRVALHVDQVVGNQEVVVKNLGPQLARLPGLAGMSLLASGEVVPIYNPVALAAVYGRRAAAGAAPHVPVVVEAREEPRAPLVLVVDDSLTVRRVTQRLLVREGFRVATAKDGLDALEQLEAERPAVVLSDIEMPRMDGFDLLRNIRHDPRWQTLPVVMITSRIAQKHRDLAGELGADHYLGKPYDEEQLVGLVRGHVEKTVSA